MGREFASAAARWCHLKDFDVRPEIVAICNRTLNAPKIDWFRKNFPTIKQVTSDYKQLLANPGVEAVYVAVPHNLHREIYCDTLKAGKHLMGEKPFGIDLAANNDINRSIKEHPECFVRCVSQFIFFPAVQRIGRMFEENAFGRIIEVNCGFLHSSDLDPEKPINWKRMIQYNGEYGVMGDLGIHSLYIPLRAGIVPLDVRSVLSNIITERPGGQKDKTPCETWDNAALLCRSEYNDDVFPLTCKIQRISPGHKNTWYFEVMGTKASARFSTKNVNEIEILEYTGGEQAWKKIDMGHEMTFETITAKIFEAGFSDIILQMWAAYLYELENGRPFSKFAGCLTPGEVSTSHSILKAALESHKKTATVPVEYVDEYAGIKNSR